MIGGPGIQMNSYMGACQPIFQVRRDPAVPFRISLSRRLLLSLTLGWSVVSYIDPRRDQSTLGRSRSLCDLRRSRRAYRIVASSGRKGIVRTVLPLFPALQARTRTA
jgi:hypothetical protein